jgi:N12 class adenine-specific DNA methylase/SAM-dependent methyltransferase
MPPELLTLFDLFTLDPTHVASAPPTAVSTATYLSGYRIPGTGRGLAAGWKNRAADNVEAIRLARDLATAGAIADAEQMQLLAKYAGFGATDLAQALFPIGDTPVRAGWESIAEQLHKLVTSRDRKWMASSTQYAHYTPVDIMRAIWAAIERLGFTGGRVLEPGCGTGLFIAAAPPALDGALDWTGVELDPTTAMIAKALQPDATIIVGDFAKTKSRSAYDLAIGNPPFATTTIIGEGHAGRLGLRLHDYFIARSLELVRPGGLAAFVTSHGTLDKGATKARDYMASLAELIGAVRLPQGAMREEAGTDVVVDILFFRRSESPVNGDTWRDLIEVSPADGPGEKPMFVNRYYAEHPEMVLGAHAWTSSPFGPVYTCRSPIAHSCSAALRAALDTLPGLAPAATTPIVAAPAAPATPPTPIAIVPDPLTLAIAPPAGIAPTSTLFALPDVPAATPSTTTPKPVLRAITARLSAAERALDAAAYPPKEGSYIVNRHDQLCQYNDAHLDIIPVKADRLVPGMPAKTVRVIRAYIDIRNALRAVITAQAEDLPWDAAQNRLLKAYRAFVEDFGPINLTKTYHRIDPKTGDEFPTHRRPNISAFDEDPDCWLVASAERYDTETDTAQPGPIFTERVVRPPAEPVIATAEDALAATLDAIGRVDINQIAAQLGVSRELAIEQLGDAIYSVPNSDDTWLTADDYLSGPVRKKLVIAKAAAETDARYQRNVDALTLAIPKDLNPSDVTARLGSPWIPASDIEQFIKDTMDITTTVQHTPAVAAWDVNKWSFESRPAATSEWGTRRRHAGLLMHDALNGASPQIFDTEVVDGKDVRVLNAVETEAAREKLCKIKDAFSNWIWKDEERAFRLIRIYNDSYNDLAPREFDGEHLKLRGAATGIVLRKHQKRGVWRIITSGSTYVAHSVGAGKTFTIAAACMEQRRLGLVTKPMIVVPGHCLAQFSREFMELYPMANILVADEATFEKSKRDRFIARATTGSWDAIIITHSAFKFIPSPGDFEADMIDRQTEAIEALVSKLKAQAGGVDNTSRKKLEQRREALRRRYEALRGRKDDMVTLKEIGIDQLIVDEAQQFRKLDFSTNAGTIKGIDPSGSQRAWDLYVKSKFIATLRPTRALILASGTPITNTLAEMFTIQRYIAEDALFERDINEFDAWRAIFGDTITELELQPGGAYKPVTRFAEFQNIPELVAMFRQFADVVQRHDLRDLIDLPVIKGGTREIVTAAATDAFKDYQEILAKRIDAIKNRHGRPEPGEDIILSVITDGRHAAIDVRLVDPTAGDEPDNKLNALITNVHRIYTETSGNIYRDAHGNPSGRPGAAQMVFSDLGTLAIGKKRGFSAYAWIREQLIARGIPPNEIVFMQDVKRSSEKQDLFNKVKTGEVRVLIGSTETMGTGVNVQKRLKALHHLDVPWIPSHIEQREGRIERQGNENDEIEIYAYATPGSMDAPMWQSLQRKATFIAAAMAGDRSVRRIEDASAQANSFAIAKAIASGNPLLMQKAGLEADIARMRRLRSAHFDDQYGLRTVIATAKDRIRIAEEALIDLRTDYERSCSTRGDDFALSAFGERFTSRSEAGKHLVARMYDLPTSESGINVGSIGGFDLIGRARRDYQTNEIVMEYGIKLTDRNLWPGNKADNVSPVGVIRTLENMVAKVPDLIAQTQAQLDSAKRSLRDATPRVGSSFDHEAELETKVAELVHVEAELVRESNEAEAARKAKESAKSATATDDTDIVEEPTSSDDAMPTPIAFASTHAAETEKAA